MPLASNHRKRDLAEGNRLLGIELTQLEAGGQHTAASLVDARLGGFPFGKLTLEEFHVEMLPGAVASAFQIHTRVQRRRCGVSGICVLAVLIPQPRNAATE